ncbi:MAG: Ig-like domain-containing protein [Clostridia bacterium]|nr:Ig-like domain-containing protein [Clostridia bacterium]
MKRIGAIVCVMMMAVAMLAPACLAADNEGTDAVNKTGFTILTSSPEDGTEGVAVDNLSVKITFSKEMQPKNKKVRNENAKQFKLKDSKGNKIPVQVYYSDEEEGLVLVAADTFSSKNKNKRIKGDEQYVLTIGRNLQATDGTTLGEQQTIAMKTLNQGRSTAIYMILMFLMMGGMIFFTVRGSKKDEKKKKEERQFKEGVNPYKEAKRSGKSVQEVVEKESRKKRKKEEAIRRQQEAEAAIEAEIIEKIRKESNKRVSAPKSIADAGSKYKLKVVTDSGKKVEEPKAAAAKTNKGTTNPKNQKGKNKNKKKGGKKK